MNIFQRSLIHQRNAKLLCDNKSKESDTDMSKQ